MAKRLLLISNSTNFGENFLDHTREYISRFLGNDIREVLFIPYAAVTFSNIEYTNRVNEVFTQWGYAVRSIEDSDNKARAVEKAEAIVIGGGNTFQLVNKLYQTGIMDAIRKKVSAGTPFIGWSAGSNVACPSLRTTNDMPIVQPPSFDTLNLVPFQINPHYTDAVIPNFNGEAREERIREFLALNQELTVVGLKEGSALLVEDQSVCLLGSKTVKVFKNQQPAMEYDKNSPLDFLLQ